MAKELRSLLTPKGEGETEVPFGKERVTNRTARARFLRAQTPEERQAIIEEIGVEEALKAVRSRVNGPGKKPQGFGTG